MPTVAIVDGVKIQLFAREHPPPHFHAVFAEYRASIEIAGLQVMQGSLPPAKLAAVIRWAEQHRGALLRNWNLVAANERPEKIG